MIIAMVGVLLRKLIRNEDIRKRTTVTDISHRIDKPTFISGSGQGVVQITDRRCGQKILEWRRSTRSNRVYCTA